MHMHTHWLRLLRGIIDSELALKIGTPRIPDATARHAQCVLLPGGYHRGFVIEWMGQHACGQGSSMSLSPGE